MSDSNREKMGNKVNKGGKQGGFQGGRDKDQEIKNPNLPKEDDDSHLGRK